MNINWLDWLGYLASLIVLISLLMSSIKRLRWINLVGSCIFALYGFLLGSLPVGFMNLGIAIINIYYLLNIYRSTELFKTLHIGKNSEYLRYFLDYYKDDISKYNDISEVGVRDSKVKFFVLRNMVVAGVFICSKRSDDTLNIEVDFVTPEYRDFKIGSYIFENNRNYFIENGYKKFISSSSNPEYINYLRKMGFEEKVINGSKCYIKSLK
ncbi:hypothetical protein RJG79_07570 [Mycoplasmatota bacterium WC44]